MKYLIGADNAAAGLKKVITDYLSQQGIPFKDVGVMDEHDETPYPQIAKVVAEEIITNNYTQNGILLCGTGLGMAITANKFPGIYAATCHDTYSAERARLSNNTNIITIGARVVGPELAKKILETWLKLEFKPSASSNKIALISDYEKRNFKM